MTAKQARTGIVNLRYTARGNGAAGKMTKAVRYYTFRDGPDIGERTWETAEGQKLTPEEAREFAKEQAGTHGFTYQIVLSAEQGLDLGSDGYRQFLDAEGFKNYMLIQHHNTDNAHAHVIAWRSQVIPKKEIAGFIDRYDQTAASIKEQQRERGQLDQAEARTTTTPESDLLDIVTEPTTTGQDMTTTAEELRSGQGRGEDEELLAFLDRLGTEPEQDYSDLWDAVTYGGEARQDMADTAHELRERPEISAEDEAFLRFLETLDNQHQAEPERELDRERDRQAEQELEPEQAPGRKRDRGIELDI